MKKRRLLLFYLLLKSIQARKSRRRYYIRPINNENVQQRCEIFWRHYEADDENELRAFCRFTPTLFDKLHDSIVEGLRRRNTHRYPLKTKERLSIFLR